MKRRKLLAGLGTIVALTLQQNPELAAIRQQHGIAAGSVVIARTYPFNPVAQSAVFSVKGEPGLRPIKQQHQVTLEVELLGQRGHRQQAAFAALSRADSAPPRSGEHNEDPVGVLPVPSSTSRKSVRVFARNAPIMVAGKGQVESEAGIRGDPENFLAGSVVGAQSRNRT